MAKPGDSEDTNEVAGAVLRGIVKPPATQIGSAVDTSGAGCTTQCSQKWTVEWYKEEVSKFNSAYSACANAHEICYGDRLKECDSYGDGMTRQICQQDARWYCFNELSVCQSRIPAPGGPLYGDSRETGVFNVAKAADVKYQACIKNCQSLET